MSKNKNQAPQTDAPDAPSAEVVKEAQAKPAKADGVRLKHDSISSISHDGVTYTADKGGIFVVAPAHAAALREAFGLIAAE